MWVRVTTRQTAYKISQKSSVRQLPDLYLAPRSLRSSQTRKRSVTAAWLAILRRWCCDPLRLRSMGFEDDSDFEEYFYESRGDTFDDLDDPEAYGVCCCYRYQEPHCIFKAVLCGWDGGEGENWCVSWSGPDPYKNHPYRPPHRRTRRTFAFDDVDDTDCVWGVFLLAQTKVALGAVKGVRTFIGMMIMIEGG